MNVTAGMAGTPKVEFHIGVHDGQNRGGKPDGFCQKEARMFSGKEKIRASLRGTFYGNAEGVSVKTTQTGVQGGQHEPVLPDVRRMSDCKQSVRCGNPLAGFERRSFRPVT